MDELLSAVLDAHGGLDNWQRVRTLRVGFSRGGPFVDGLELVGGAASMQ